MVAICCRALLVLSLGLCLGACLPGWAESQPPPFPNEEMRISYRAFQALSAALDEWGEAQAAKLAPEARADRVVAGFLKAAGVTPADLSQARARRERNANSHVPLNVETVLLRELALFAYQRADAALVEAARRRGIDWEQDSRAALLARTAGLPPAQRAKIIVDAIAVSAPEERDEEILANTGREGRRYAMRRLARLEAPGNAAPAPGAASLRKLLSKPSLITPTPPAAQGKLGRFYPGTGTYVAPAPDRLPRLAPGQAFFCLPDTEPYPVLANARTGASLPAEAAALKKLTLTAVEPGDEEGHLRLRFTLEGYPDPVLWEGDGELYDLPCLHPLVEDDGVRRLRSRYLNRRVWSYGDGYGDIRNGFSFPAAEVSEQQSKKTPGRGEGLQAGADDPYAPSSSSFENGGAVVRRIVRLRSGTPFPLLIGNFPSDGGFLESTSTVIGTYSPLVVVLEFPKGVPVPGPVYSNNGVPVHLDLRADVWDFERTYSLLSPEAMTRNWPPLLRRAAQQGRLAKGMTREMVAWVVGFPGEYGTKEEILNRPRDRWRYSYLPPYNNWVYFRDGRVTHWGPDGNLPGSFVR